jgi:hypothetical protein
MPVSLTLASGIKEHLDFISINQAFMIFVARHGHPFKFLIHERNFSVINM